MIILSNSTCKINHIMETKAINSLACRRCRCKWAFQSRTRIITRLFNVNISPQVSARIRQIVILLMAKWIRNLNKASGGNLHRDNINNNHRSLFKYQFRNRYNINKSNSYQNRKFNNSHYRNHQLYHNNQHHLKIWQMIQLLWTI